MISSLLEILLEVPFETEAPYYIGALGNLFLSVSDFSSWYWLI